MLNAIAKNPQTGRYLHSQFNGGIAIPLANKVLAHTSYVDIVKRARGGYDLTARFSVVAQALLAEDDIIGVRIRKSEGTPHQYMHLARNTRQNLSAEQLDSLRDRVAALLADHPAIDEQALLAWADADRQSDFNENSAEFFAAEYMRNNFIPERKESTKDKEYPEGHAIEGKFIRFLREDDGSLKSGITLGDQCTTCASAFLSTLRILNDSLGDYLINLAGPENALNLSGIRVLPSRLGSPSFLYNATPKKLENK